MAEEGEKKARSMKSTYIGLGANTLVWFNSDNVTLFCENSYTTAEQ